MSDITGVDFVALQVSDHARAARFYGETLGLPFVKTWGKMPASEFQAGNLTLAVMQSDAFGLEFRPSSSMVALAVDDVAAKRAEALFAPRLAKLQGGPRNLAGALEAMHLCAAKVDAQRVSAVKWFTE
jgi:catechol 2,3-dioxygenase-like lactoylglutathione lyase family enzyme